MATLDELKSELFKSIYYNLGGDIVDVELDPNHYEYGLKQAIEIYRQRSSNSVEESNIFLNLVADQQEYILPNEIMSVQQVFRRSIGSSSTDNVTQFEPFEAGFMNMYLLQSGRVGGLANYEFFSQYQEISSRMFGGHINFHFNPVTKKLTLVRRPRNSDETVLLWVHNHKPDFTLLQDVYAFPWIRGYTQALVKKSLGEAREKFATVAGPAGGTVLNGAALKAEAQAEIETLIQDLNNYIDGGSPMWFVIG
jgi:hypothetical protein